jgi:NADPH-dependent glutamate synthase beta chain and related oxidoreductases
LRGNVCIGNDLTLQDLEENFDIVVIATGLNTDRQMGIPGDNLECVIGAGRLLRAINGYPQQIEHFPRKIDALGERVVVVGNGNVAMDIIRLISKTEGELIGSDINDSIRKELAVDKI